MDNKKQAFWRYGFVFVTLTIGLILNYFRLGQNFLGFASVGDWLIYVGFVMLIVITLRTLSNKKRIVDERAQFIGMKASRITYVFIILTLFTVMIIDGVKSISVPYSSFMSLLICGITLVYLISYKILERFN